MHKLGNFHTLVGQPSKPPQAWPNARRRFEAGRCPTSLSELSFSDKTGSHQRSVSATVPSQMEFAPVAQGEKVFAPSKAWLAFASKTESVSMIGIKENLATNTVTACVSSR